MAKRRKRTPQTERQPAWPKIMLGLAALAVVVGGALYVRAGLGQSSPIAGGEETPLAGTAAVLTRSLPAPTPSPLAPPEASSIKPRSTASSGDVAGPAPNETPPPVYSYNVVNTYPHDPDAFTQGLIFEDGVLYEGTGLRGASTLRKVALESGTVLQSYELPVQFFGEGITSFDNKLIQLTWQSKVGFVYDKDSFELLQEFSYPTEGWGLTHDGQHLIMSDGTAFLYFLEPDTFAAVKRVEVLDRGEPVTLLNELEYIDQEIYANVWKTSRIARISPETGQVLGWVELDGLLEPEDVTQPVDVLNGIAYDAEQDRLFVTGKWWPKLFEIELVPEE